MDVNLEVRSWDKGLYDVTIRAFPVRLSESALCLTWDNLRPLPVDFCEAAGPLWWPCLLLQLHFLSLSTSPRCSPQALSGGILEHPPRAVRSPIFRTRGQGFREAKCPCPLGQWLSIGYLAVPGGVCGHMEVGTRDSQGRRMTKQLIMPQCQDPGSPHSPTRHIGGSKVRTFTLHTGSEWGDLAGGRRKEDDMQWCAQLGVRWKGTPKGTCALASPQQAVNKPFFPIKYLAQGILLQDWKTD